jgi:hypothetical protein
MPKPWSKLWFQPTVTTSAVPLPPRCLCSVVACWNYASYRQPNPSCVNRSGTAYEKRISPLFTGVVLLAEWLAPEHTVLPMRESEGQEPQERRPMEDETDGHGLAIAWPWGRSLFRWPAMPIPMLSLEGLSPNERPNGRTLGRNVPDSTRQDQTGVRQWQSWRSLTGFDHRCQDLHLPGTPRT